MLDEQVFNSIQGSITMLSNNFDGFARRMEDSLTHLNGRVEHLGEQVEEVRLTLAAQTPKVEALVRRHDEEDATRKERWKVLGAYALKAVAAVLFTALAGAATAAGWNWAASLIHTVSTATS